MQINKILKDYKNLKILITGTTGFKGSWLTKILLRSNAKIYGVGLKPKKDQKLFKLFKIDRKINQNYFDITNFKKIDNFIKKIKPDIIFHLAAQPLISSAYTDPVDTIKTNIIGGTNILESVRKNSLKNLIFITSDKCYLNNDQGKSFNELDPLGGNEVYSASKASQEILFKAYLKTYYNYKKIKFATTRSGNIIGGGDFNENRIVPDIIRSIFLKKNLVIRNKNSVRPWLYILEPLIGYIILGHKILKNKLNKNIYPSWNFGPTKQNLVDVKKIIEIFHNFHDQQDINIKYKKIKYLKSKFNEQKFLSLDIYKSKKELNWSPKLGIQETCKFTFEWYRRYFQNLDVDNFSENQIEEYISLWK
tara:strand:+ start:4998 stop:6086 length:1089 start_codon:yes stop_codon:yes gene_type:complete